MTIPIHLFLEPACHDKVLQVHSTPNIMLPEYSCSPRKSPNVQIINTQVIMLHFNTQPHQNNVETQIHAPIIIKSSSLQTNEISIISLMHHHIGCLWFFVFCTPIHTNNCTIFSDNTLIVSMIAVNHSQKFDVPIISHRKQKKRHNKHTH